MAQLKRILGLFELVVYGVGLIIGAGVYSVIGAAAGEAREALWLSFVAGAVIASLTALSYAELATALPKAGVEYAYMRRAFPRWRWAAFVVGFLLVVAGASVATTVAVAFAGYLSLFLPTPQLFSAIALLGLMTALQIWGLRQASWVAILSTAIEIAGLVLVVWMGSTHADEPAQAFAGPLHGGVLTGTALIFFVYLGFESLASLAEDARRPERDLPRAILLSIGITTVLYVLVALAVVALLAPEKLAASDSPLSAAVEAYSPRVAWILGIIALFSTANTVLITLITTARRLFAIARAGELPQTIARVIPGRNTPWMAGLILLAVSLALLPAGGLKVVAGLSSFASLLAFLAVNAALVALRFREPDLERPFRVPLSLRRVPLLPLLAILSILALLPSFEPGVYAIGLAALLLAVAVYALQQRRAAP